MDRINEMLGRLSELSTDELKELQDAIVTEFGVVSEQDLTREVADQMTTLGNAAQAIREEESRRESEAAELANLAETAATLINGTPPEQAEEQEEGADPEEEGDDIATKEKKKKDVVPEDKEAPSELSAETEVTTSVSETPESVASTTEVEAAATEPVSEEAELATESLPEVVKASEKLTEEKPVEDEEKVETGELVTPEPEVTSETAPEANEEAEVAVESEPEEASDEESTTEEDSEETVTAAASTEGLDIQVPEENRLKDVKVAAPVTITAGADIPGVSAGTELPNLRSVAQAIIDRKKGMGRTSGGDGEQHTVATFSTAFPEDRRLISNDFEGNSKKIENVVSEPALVAAGGLCAPVEVSYDIFGLGELGRPVRDSLAVFAADRGGIRFVTPPVLSDLDGAVSLWTLQDDIDAATPGAPDPVKPCLRVACGTEVTVYTDAIPLCLTFGNMGARAYPELVERHTQLGMINHARYAETRLLTRIGALSTAVTSAAQLGAARDIFVAVEQAAAGYRNRHRMSPEAKLRVIFPEWFRNALRADLTKQLPGDGDETTFALADARVDSWFRIRNIETTWSLDGETGQILGEQAPGALNDFPDEVVWYLFAEGTFLFLDGGTLDLGIVRDSTLNGTNDYKIFLETFEGVAKVGIESLRVTTELAIAGASAATVDTIA